MSDVDDAVSSMNRRWSATLKVTPESDTYLRSIHAWRNTWRPSAVKLLLIAESHVREDLGDNKVSVDLGSYDVQGETLGGYCRLVYCPAYGDDTVCKPSAPTSNKGTNAYWQLFDRIVGASMDGYVLKAGGLVKGRRTGVKLMLLARMQELGIWLVDASVLGIARSGNRGPIATGKDYADLLLESWMSCVHPTIAFEKPAQVWIIGAGVRRVVGGRLGALGDRVRHVVQPAFGHKKDHDAQLAKLLPQLPWAPSSVEKSTQQEKGDRTSADIPEPLTPPAAPDPRAAPRR